MSKNADTGIVIGHKFDKSTVKLLQSRGVSTADVLRTKGFNLEESLMKIQYEGASVRKVTVEKQLGYYESMVKKRLVSGKWMTAGIGSFPTDLRAKQVAIELFAQAMDHHQQALKSKQRFNKSLPLWHRVYGGFGDSLRDMKGSFPSFIVLSNIDPQDTDLKFEKVRDILARANSVNVPVLVVCGGIDPLTLFNNRLHCALNYGLMVCGDNARRNLI